MRKKLLSILMATAMVACMTGCGSNADSTSAEQTEVQTEDSKENADDQSDGQSGDQGEAAEQSVIEGEGDTIALKIWGSQTDQDLLKELCEEFAKEHPENSWQFDYGVVGEADAQARYIEDPAAAADVFSYPDDQLMTLVQADALYEVTRDVDEVKSANAPGSIDAASYNGVLYGYPMTEFLQQLTKQASRYIWIYQTDGILHLSSLETDVTYHLMKMVSRSVTSIMKRDLQLLKQSEISVMILRS